MKQILKWLAVISFVIFVIAWGVIGLKMIDNNYLITAEAYVGMFSLVIFFIGILYVKSTNRCPHCGKAKISFGTYCPYCGKKID